MIHPAFRKLKRAERDRYHEGIGGGRLLGRIANLETQLHKIARLIWQVYFSVEFETEGMNWVRFCLMRKPTDPPLFMTAFSFATESDWNLKMEPCVRIAWKSFGCDIDEYEDDYYVMGFVQGLAEVFSVDVKNVEA